MSNKPVDPTTEAALRQLEVTALNFAYQAINISSVRSLYVRRAQEMTSSLRQAYRSGEMSAKAAAEAAHGMPCPVSICEIVTCRTPVHWVSRVRVKPSCRRSPRNAPQLLRGTGEKRRRNHQQCIRQTVSPVPFPIADVVGRANDSPIHSNPPH